MPVQNRIIAGGFLVIGIAIVLILLYLFQWGGISPKEGYEKVLFELYPRYVTAEEDRDYGAMRKIATEIEETLEDAGRGTVIKRVLADASAGRRGARQCLQLLEDDVFARNAEGLFAFDTGFFRQAVHGAFVRLAAIVDGELKLLRSFRETARHARKAISEAQIASGGELGIPPAAYVAKDPSPIVEPNPVYAHDTELYRVFGVKPADLEAALGSQAPGGGRAKSARLRWNKNIAGSTLSANAQSLPEDAESLKRAAIEFQGLTATIASSPEAGDVLDFYMKKASAAVGSGLEGPLAAQFREHRAKFETGAAITSVMEQEAKLILAYLDTVRELGRLFGQKFEE